MTLQELEQLAESWKEHVNSEPWDENNPAHVKVKQIKLDGGPNIEFFNGYEAALKAAKKREKELVEALRNLLREGGDHHAIRRGVWIGFGETDEYKKAQALLKDIEQ